MTPLRDHRFLTSTISPLASKIIEKSGPEGPSNPSSGDGYVIQALLAAGELSSLLDQLVYAVRSLSGYRRSQGKKRPFITRSDHISYHLENHLVRSVSVYDRSLQLTNLVFQLGIPERACSRDTVARNSNVQVTSVPAALNDIDATVKPWRERRNIVVHRRGYSDGEFLDIEGYYVLERIDVEGDDSSSIERFRALYKTLTDEYVRSRREELTRLNEDIENGLVRLFDALDPVFKSRHELLTLSNG